MTSASEQQQTETIVNQHLDNANQQLPAHVRNDIRRARQRALAAQTLRKTGYWQRIIDWLSAYKWALSMPTGVAVAVLILVSYNSTHSIEALPMDMLTTDIPSEDLELLEDLEFATWLAEQQEVTN